MAFKDYSKDIANARKNKKEEKSSTTSSSYKDYSADIDKYRSSKVIGFDTLESDLASLSDRIRTVYNGWQTRETMENTRSSVQSMYDRLGKLQEYNKKYGGADISETYNALKSVLDDWDGISKQYGKYKNADAYNKAVTNAKKQAEEYEGMKVADLGVVQKEVTDLEAILETAKKYNDKAIDYSKQSMNIRNPSAVDGFSKTLKKLTDERDAYLKSVGYESMEALEKAVGEKRVYLGKAQRLQDSIALSSVADMKSENYDKDFDKYAEKGKALGQEKNDWWNGGGTYKNQIAYMRENPEYLKTYEDASDDNGKIVQSISLNQLNYLGAKYMTDDEAKVYNYYIGKEDEKGAENYLKSIEETLKQRQGTAIYDERENMLSKYTFGYTAGIDQFTQGIINEFNTKDSYIPTTGIQNASGLVREDIQYEHGTLGQVGYDLINTTSNMLPSILTSTVVSAVATPVAGQVVGSTLMGTSAAGNAYQEMLNLGYDKGQARTYSTLVGFAESGLQSVMGGIGKLGGVSGKLSKLVSGIDNGLAKFAIRMGGSVLSEGLEEATQEVLAPIFKNLSAGYDTGAEIDWGEVVYSGLLGALSGGVLEGGGVALDTYSETSYNKNMGQTIKSNERVGDMFDIASTSPEVSSAYEAYTRYANKGINEENISDAKLGNLYSSVKADAKETLESKESTEEQRTEALKTLTRLSTVVTENTVKKEAKAEFNVGEETKVTDSGVEVDVKDLKINGDEVTFTTENGDVSVDDVTLTQKDAELVLLAKGIAKTDGEDMANLFISQYDGTTSAEEYATSFNLTMAYAKNDFTYETILNKKGSLSSKQVNAIYAETRIKADRERQNKIDELNKKMADKMSYKGDLDDSAIDKATWNKLDSQQKQAVTFIKGIAQATGMNLVLTHNPKSKTGGSYEVKGNTITIDVAKFKNSAGKVMETIIPTMSHETTHWMEAKSPELWRKMNELVFSTLQEADGLSEVDRISIEMKKLKGKGRKGTEKEARSEIIARACEDMLSMSEQGKKIFNSLSESEQKTLKEKIKEIIENLKDWVSELLGAYKSNSYEAKLMRKYEEKLNELSKLWDEMFAESVVANQSLEKSGAYVHEITSIGTTELSDLSEAVGTDGEKLFQYRAFVEDENIYREMLLEHKDIIGISNEQINALFDTIDKAVDIISQNLEALDYAWDVDVNDRAFSPVKPNSDSLYKVSLDFSTLCRKRLLQQTIQQTLQNALDKNLSKEESIAIRDELIKIQEEGRQIKVACALCYVESARMKSPAQINKFLNNREAIIKEFFANRSGGSIKEKIAKAEEKARKNLQKANPDGLVGKNGVVLDALTAPKSKMLKADADYIRAEGKKAKASYKLTEHEQAELDVAKGMSIDNFTSAKGLENLAKQHPELFDAYTSFVRNATHSKGIENDTWWRAGDSDAIGETLIAQMNAENGLRSQSWSDFQVIHLLDYIAATIELSTKGAKRQSYTKVPDYVKLLGNTGDMINMSLIPERVFEGKLSYDGVEGMAYDIAKQLRDEYHETVGTICIGINNEQIRMLLADSTIDMVIPYHHSSMSKAVRKLMHIPAWESYQNWQNEKKLSDDADAKANAKKYGVKLNKENNYQVAPKFSEWFDIDEARQIAKLENANPSNKEAYKKYGKMYGGYMAMQNAANNYLKLCAERGIAPKFSSKEADFTQDANYWKLLIDRKMVDNVTGEIIEQKPIKPIFNEQHILEILNDELARYPQVKADQEYATRMVTEKFLSGEMDVDKSTLDAIKKPIDNITEVNILESARDGVLNSDRYEVIDIPFDMYSTMEKHFGTTKNFDVAGYMLRDGKMLDFSGKHWGDTTSTFRQVDHRDIQEVLEDNHNGVQAMVSMISNGNIRLMPEVGGINLANEPNGLQAPVLRDYINHFKGEVTIDIDAIGGDTIHSFEYSKGTSASKILADLEGYFRKGEIPTRTKSNLAEFLYSDRDYSYESIIAKPDMKLTVLDDNVPNNRADIINQAKNNAAKVGNVNTQDKTVSVYVDDIDKNILLGTDGLQHGLARGKNIQNRPIAIVTLKAGEIIKNSIRINELTPSKESATGSYILIGSAIDSKGNLYLVRSVVNEYSNKLASMDVLYAINTKKESAMLNASRYAKKSLSVTDSTISIAELLDYVNKYFPDILPESVLRHYGYDARPKGELGEDALFSDREDISVYDILGETDRILAENEKLKADINRLNERLKIERKVTKGNYFNANQLGAVAGHLRNISNSTIDKVELMKGLKEVYSYIAQSPDMIADELIEKCYRIADAILEKSKPEVIVDDYYKTILKDIKNTRISFSESQKKEAQNIFDKNWNRFFFGNVIVTDKGIGLESKWQEWASQYPGVFDAEINDGDMVGELYRVISTLREASETIVEYNEEERKAWLVNEIYNQYWNLSPIKTTADKYNERIKQLNFEHRKAMKELRDDYNSRLEAQKLADDIHYGKKVSDVSKKTAKVEEKRKADREKFQNLYKTLRDRKDKEIALAKQHGRERMEKYKENAERKTILQSLMATVMSLNKKLITNSKDVHIPESLKPVVTNLLNSIDFSSKQLLDKGVPTKADISAEKALSKVHSLASVDSDVVSLKTAIQDALELFENAEKILNESSNVSVDSGIVALDVDMVKDIKNMIRKLDVLEKNGESSFVMQKMSTEHLKILNAMVKSINHWAIVADKSLKNKHRERITVRSMRNIDEMDALGERQEHIEAFEMVKNFFTWNQALPVNVFKRLGPAAMEFFQDLLDSQGQCAFNRQSVADFTEKLFKKYDLKNIKKWRTDVKTFEIMLPGETKATKISMPVSFIMTLHCVAKQEDAQRHLYGKDALGEKLTYKDANGNVHDGGGMTIKGYKDSKLSLKVNKSLDNTIINADIVKRITSVLTKEQIEVADALQKYMNEKGSEWGNAVSMALYGIEKFAVKDYFPITVSPHTLNADKIRDEKISLFSILNYGFTKERNPDAKNSIEIADIFEVFANHMNMMAIYNAYALSIYDVARWLNFKGKTDKGGNISVTQSIEKAFGKGALTYVNNLIKDLNGQHVSSRIGLVGTMFRNTKVAMVGNSVSVALLQPTAYIKAMIKISPVNLSKALAVPHLVKRGIERAQKYSGLALLKSQGYFETGISASATTKMLHDESFMEKRREGSLLGAEWGDKITWGVLWNACEFEVRAKRKDLKVGSDEYFKAVSQKLDEVICETQVVDSPLTKSDIMRSPDTKAKELTQFASELTVAYNIAFECIFETVLDAKRMGKNGKRDIKGAVKKNAKNITLSLTSYTLTSAACAVLSAMINDFRYRDDEDEETFFEKFKANFLADVLIVGKIPFFKDALSLFQGYDTTRTETMPLVSAFKAYEYYKKAVEQEDKKHSAKSKEAIANAEKWKEIYEDSAIDEIIKSVSYTIGYGIYNQWRDLRALLKFIGIMD